MSSLVILAASDVEISSGKTDKQTNKHKPPKFGKNRTTDVSLRDIYILKFCKMYSFLVQLTLHPCTDGVIFVWSI